jgi:hypothetical protein
MLPPRVPADLNWWTTVPLLPGSTMMSMDIKCSPVPMSENRVSVRGSVVLLGLCGWSLAWMNVL